MRKAFAQARRLLATALRRTAERLEPLAPVVPPRAGICSGDPEGDRANQLCAQMYLRRALRRHQPQEQPAEA